MTAAEIDAYARTKSPLPEDASITDYALYSALTKIYGWYDIKAISESAAKVCKANAIRDFEVQVLQRKVHDQQARRMVQINLILDEAERSDDDYARDLSKLLRQELYGVEVRM